MPKRRATPDSNDEQDSDASPISKRARTAGLSEEEDVPSPKRRNKRAGPSKGKGKARQNDDDSDEDAEPPNEEEVEKRFEEEHTDKIRAAIESRQQCVGVGITPVLLRFGH